MTWDDAIAAARAAKIQAFVHIQGAGQGGNPISTSATRCRRCTRFARLTDGLCAGCGAPRAERALAPEDAWIADSSGCAMEVRLDAAAERAAVCQRAGVTP